jgi:hypothetical protein
MVYDTVCLTEVIMKTILVNDLAKVESSNINLVAFGTNKLYVQFKNGGLYQYNNVMQEDYNNLKNAESVGKFLNTSIKPNYEFEKLEDTKIEIEKPAEPQTPLEQEVVLLRKQVEDLFQALIIKQEKIDELETALGK